MAYFTILLLQSLVDDPGLSITEAKGHVTINCQMTQVCKNECQGHLCIASYRISRNIKQSKNERFILQIQYQILARRNFSHFSSPEPKAQVSFSDQNLFVLGHCRYRRRKLFTFSSSPPEPVGQFQLNLAQSILG